MNTTVLTKLRKTLSHLYFTEADIRRVLHDADIYAGQISFTGSAENIWHSLLTEADKQHQVVQLLSVAATDYPKNEELQAVIQVYYQQTDANGTSSLKSIPVKRQQRWHFALIILLATMLIGLLWYQGCLPTGMTTSSPPASTPEKTVLPTTETTESTLTSTDTPTIASAETTALSTITLSSKVTTTVESSPTEVPVTTAGLQIVDALNENSYLLEGRNVEHFNVGNDLVVYGEPNPGIELVIALVKVTGKSNNALTAQVLLQHPDYPIRTKMRVDDNLDFLSESQLIPVFDYVDGYLLRPTRIRLRPGHGLVVGAQLQALAYERIGEEIVDALPMVPSVQMQVTSLGMDGQIAGVDLIAGAWPVTGTVVTLMAKEEPISISDSMPADCDKVAYDTNLSKGIRAYIAFSSYAENHVRKQPTINAEISDDIKSGTIVTISEGPICADKWLWWHVTYTKNGQIQSGWISEGNEKDGRVKHWLQPSFDGLWYTNFAEMNLIQSNTHVTGTYGYYNFEITAPISGTYNLNGTLTGKYGKNLLNEFTFILSNDGQSFRGEWLYEGKVYPWCGVRSGPLPPNCGFSGVWQTNRGERLELEQEADRVAGYYFYDGQRGEIIDGNFEFFGNCDDHSVYGTYSDNENNGNFRFSLVDYNNKQLQGYSQDHATGKQVEWYAWRNGSNEPAVHMPQKSRECHPEEW